jgi:hypothetical protein
VTPGVQDPDKLCLNLIQRGGAGPIGISFMFYQTF